MQYTTGNTPIVNNMPSLLFPKDIATKRSYSDGGAGGVLQTVPPEVVLKKLLPASKTGSAGIPTTKPTDASAKYTSRNELHNVKP